MVEQPQEHPSPAEEQWTVGHRVRVHTTLGEDIEGEVYGFDKATRCVVLQDGADTPTQRKSYRIINTSFVLKTQFLGSVTSDLRPVRPVDLEKVKIKEAAALAEAQKELDRIGVGVTSEAQRIFNALAKTLPCRWDNDTIIVFDDLRIVSPYRVEDATGGAQTSANELNRVKRVLDGETRKLGLS